MTQNYVKFDDLVKTIDSIPTESIVSRTLYKREDNFKSIVFAFAPGQELSEHTASVPAVIQILQGECTVTLGPDSFEAKAGFWAHMQPNLKHSVLAKTPVLMLLLMLSK
jgi:quercetin dioxygenase-like cupin family protein